MGVILSRATLANWIIYCASNYFTPLYDYYHRELLKRQFPMADETQTKFNAEQFLKGFKGYLETAGAVFPIT